MEWSLESGEKSGTCAIFSNIVQDRIIIDFSPALKKSMKKIPTIIGASKLFSKKKEEKEEKEVILGKKGKLLERIDEMPCPPTIKVTR